MTEIINANFIPTHHLNTLLSSYVDRPRSTHREEGYGPHSSQTNPQACFSAIIKEMHCPYDLLLTIDPALPFNTIKIQLLKKNGNLLKIPEQQSKTYLIRKFIQFGDLYHPRIDPLTGDVYFRLDYFQLKPCRQSFSQDEIRSIYKSINLEKLYQSIHKFSAFFEHGQEHNWTETELPFKKKYANLAKALSLLNDQKCDDILSGESLASSSCMKRQSKQNSPFHKILQDLSNFASSGVKFTEQLCNKRVISKQMKQIEFEGNNLGTLTKRKNGKSNYDTLLLNQGTQKLLRENIYKMIETRTPRTNMKVVESELGKITLNLEKEDEGIYRTKLKFLNLLPRNTEYHFLDKHFKSSQTIPIMITLSLKEESLQRFLQTNSLCASMETKMRILLQICSAVHTLWQEKNIILYVSNLKKISITKNLTIKLRSLTNYCKVDPHVLLEDKGLVNVRLLDNWLNLSEIYFKIFFGFELNYMRPAAYSMAGSRSAQHMKANVMSRRLVGTKLLPEGFRDPAKQILVGLNYIFLSFIDMAQRMILQPQTRKKEELEMFMKHEQDKQRPREADQTTQLLSYKMTCCWLFKNFELITREGI